MANIIETKAIQVFDSRGIPTISCKIILDDGTEGLAMVPSGASTGSKEALELRDAEKEYLGKGVLKAVQNINNVLGPSIIGKNPIEQQLIDEILIKSDGTEDKSEYGANAILAISLAVSHSASASNGSNLHEHFAHLYSKIHGKEIDQSIPMPMLNILNGGEHANNNIDIQEFMIIPSGASSFSQAMQWSTEVYMNLKKIIEKFGHSSAVGDEGGFAPNLKNNEEALKLIISAITESDLEPGKDINIALDCAASEFYDGKKYILKGEDKIFSSE